MKPPLLFVSGTSLRLAENGEVVPDQQGKPTERPTAKWVFELFLDVHLLLIVTDTIQVMAMNLVDELQVLLELLGPAYRMMPNEGGGKSDECPARLNVSPHKRPSSTTT